MRPTPIILATRAISSEFIRREVLGLFVFGAVTIAILHILGLWLISMSSWWWILEILFIVLSSVFAILSLIVFFIIKLVKPEQTSKQRKQVKKFVDSLQELSDTAQTPKFILLFRLIKDILIPSQTSMISQITSQASSLKPDLETIIKSFSR